MEIYEITHILFPKSDVHDQLISTSYFGDQCLFIPEKREQPLCVSKFGSPYIVGWCHGGAEQTSEVCDDKGVEQGSEACWICPGIGVPSNVAGRSPLSREVLIRKSWHKWWIHQCHV